MNDYYLDEIEEDDYDPEDEELIGYDDREYKQNKDGEEIWSEMSYNRFNEKKKFVDEEDDE